MAGSIRLVRSYEFEILRQIEREAGAAFAAIGMRSVAEDEPMSVDDLAVYESEGRAWVVCDDDDHPVGYLLADEFAGHAHIEQVTVHPDYSGRGWGAALIETASGWAASRGRAQLTLTTFADVPWNAPYYARLGFVVIAPAEWPDSLHDIVDAEARHGLHRWSRVVMARPTTND